MSIAARRVGLNYGLGLGVVLIVYGLIYRATGLDSLPLTSWVFYLLLPVGVWLAQRACHRQGRLRFSQAFLVALWVTLLASGLYCLSVYGYNKWVDDSLLQESIAAAARTLEQQGQQGAQLEQSMQTVRALFQPGPFAFLVWLALLVFGLATGALVTFWTTKIQPPVLGGGETG